MSIVSVRAALETKLSAMTPALATVYENYPYAPVVGTPHQAVYLLPASPENPTMGDSYYREQGIFQISLFYPLATGPAAAAARAQLIRTQFKRGTSMGGFDAILDFDAQNDFDGIVIVRVGKTPEIGQGRVDGDRWHVPVRIVWFADITT